MIDVASLRRDFSARPFDVSDAHEDPLHQFARWFAEARQADEIDPNAMTLATATRDGRPSARVVLLKGADARGFVFYTNFESRKGRELDLNPNAALSFFWSTLARQVRVEGLVERVSDDEADAYFASRPVESRLGVWSSPQSEFVPSRAHLDARYDEACERFGAEPPRPPHWGGYRLLPAMIEFWQGRPSRMHDRIRYRREDGRWVLERLAP